MSQRQGALSRLRVLDMGRVLAAPFIGQLFGDLGADVIKVERPGTGDDFRSTSVFLTDKEGKKTKESDYFLSTNRNKRSITVDLSHPDGQALIRKLAAECDVLIENYKVGDLARYGLDYESLSKINPHLVYCSVSAYGQTGPYRLRTGYDSLFQAQSGIMSVTGHPDGHPGAGPMKAGVSIGDTNGSFHGAFAILAAIYHRDMVSGEGQYIDLSLLDANIAVLSHAAQYFFITGNPPPRSGTGAPSGAPVGAHKCKDGEIMISGSMDSAFAKLAEALGHPEWIDDPRYKTNRLRGQHKAEVTAAIENSIAHLTKKEVEALLTAGGVSCAIIYTVPEVFADPQVQHREMKVEVPHPTSHDGKVTLVASPMRLSKTPVAGYTAPPTIGQHTDEVLKEILGMDEAAIAALREAKAI
jgi:crotonobetainyl-CoA:carnitine CoA-transferase CaiB-like acyl-CoA transferase